MTLDFRELSNADQKDFLEQRMLFSLAFPETVGTSVNTEAHYKWKFSTHPDSSKSSHFLCHENNTLCGSYSALPYTYSLSGQQTLCAMVCDVMTHPSFRGKGIFTKLGAYSTNALADKGFDFTSGYPIRPEVIPGHLKVGWFIGFKAPMYINVLKVDSLLRKSSLVFLSPILNTALSLINQLVSTSSPSEFRVIQLSRKEFFENNVYADFFDRWAAGQKNFLIKTTEFLKWRTNAPDAEYHFTQLFYGEKLIGLSISRPTQLKEVPSLAVLDLMIEPNFIDKSSILFSGLRSLASNLKCEVVVMMINKPWAEKYRLFRNFFIKTPAVFSIIFKILNKKISQAEFTNSDNWHLTWLDSDDL